MDKSEILAAIKKKVYYAELPSKMHVSVMDDTPFYISIVIFQKRFLASPFIPHLLGHFSTHSF